MKIAVSAGHTPSRPGARRGIIAEYGLTSAIIGDLVFRLQKSGHQAWLIGAGDNMEQVKRINELNCDLGLELHFNSFKTSEMHGTEVLYSGSTKGNLFASCVQTSLVNKLQTSNRGIKIGHYQGDVRKPIITMIKQTNCPFIVPEPLFLSNDYDYSRIDIPLISIALLEGIETYGRLHE